VLHTLFAVLVVIAGGKHINLLENTRKNDFSERGTCLSAIPRASPFGDSPKQPPNAAAAVPCTQLITWQLATLWTKNAGPKFNFLAKQDRSSLIPIHLHCTMGGACNILTKLRGAKLPIVNNNIWLDTNFKIPIF